MKGVGGDSEPAHDKALDGIARLEGHSASRGHKPAAHLYLTFETPTGCSEGTGEEGEVLP